MTEKQKTFIPTFISVSIGFFLGLLVVLVFQNNSKTNGVNDVASDSNKQLSNLEEKITKLESVFDSIKTSPSEKFAQNTIYKPDSEMNDSTLEQLTDSLSNKLSYDLQDIKEQDKLELEQAKSTEEYQLSLQDDELSQSVFDSIQPDAPNKMTNIKEVMQSDQMHAMTREGRERVVKELVRRANNGEIDIATFFSN